MHTLSFKGNYSKLFQSFALPNSSLYFDFSSQGNFDIDAGIDTDLKKFSVRLAFFIRSLVNFLV